MSTPFIKLLLALATALLGVMSSGAIAQTYTTTVNGTSYDFTYITGSFTDNSALLQSQPWWGSESTATTFMTAVGVNLGFPADQPYGHGPYFTFSQTYIPMFGYINYASMNTSYGPDCCAAPGSSESVSYAVATPAGGIAPEMNASFIPQVALMLACLFFLFGRKKENTEPMLAV